MGNITSITGDEDLEIKYNLLNLPKEIKKSGTVVSKHAYLSDGKKVSSCDAGGNRYMYYAVFDGKMFIWKYRYHNEDDRLRFVYKFQE